MTTKKESNNDKKSFSSVQAINHNRRVFDFLRFGRLAFVISMGLVVLSVAIVIVRGFNLGLDFTGGTSVEISVSKAIDLNDIRLVLNEAGYSEPIVQYYGSSRDVIIRLPPLSEPQSGQLGLELAKLMHQSIDPAAIIKSVDFVGPTVGAELAQDGVLAILASFLSILIYIGFRFEWRLGAGAVIALAHDIVVTVGYLALFQVELDLTIIPALLSVIGYSLNDTIVVFDRIRENFRTIRRATSYGVINVSLTQTLSRTLMTSLTTLAVVACLYIWGGSLLKGFSETLIIGILLGTLSSIYVAAYLAYKMGLKRVHFMQPKLEIEGAEQK